MKFLGRALLISLQVLASCSYAQEAKTSFDGDWQVHLTCDDTRDKNGAIVKGYVFAFPVSVKAGEIHGHRGELGQSSSLVLAGVISESRKVRIEAQGYTGQPDYTVGHVHPASPYSYTLIGQFDKAHGHADRQELRRCSADFERIAKPL